MLARGRIIWLLPHYPFSRPATHTMTEKERQLAEVRTGEGGAEPYERLVLYKSFNTLGGGGIMEETK
jgi:hypothetical protein